jgi:hypothetical protein
MPPSGDNRSVNVSGSITGAPIVTGDNNNTVTTSANIILPPPDTVDPKAELTALREALANFQTPDRAKVDRAFQYAEEEAADRDPNKRQIAGALRQVLTVAKGTNDFATQIETLAPRVAALASWLGPVGHDLLSLVGLSG